MSADLFQCACCKGEEWALYSCWLDGYPHWYVECRCCKAAYLLSGSIAERLTAVELGRMTKPPWV